MRHFVQIFWFQGEVLSWVSLLSTCLHIETFLSAENREKFKPVGRLCLPHLPLAYSLWPRQAKGRGAIRADFGPMSEINFVVITI